VPRADAEGALIASAADGRARSEAKPSEDRTRSATGGDSSPLLEPGVLAALARPAAYPGDASAREITWVQTHLSHVFLSGARVYKFRKPVDLGFVRFTTRAERNADCLREVALNRRLAPDVYLGVAPLETDGGRVRVGAPQEALAEGAPEHCVVMRRLPDGRDALSLLQRGALGPAQLARVARRIARFHAACGLGVPAPYGESEWIDHCARPALANFATLRDFARDGEDRRRLERLEAATRDFPRVHAARFEARRRAGCAVDGHGDLHLQHVWFERDDAEPIAIDCLEFDAELRRIDVASEVAFLAMDLRYRGAAGLAELFLRVYASERDDFDLYRVVDWFTSYRAAVRAKVAAIAAGESEIEPAQRRRAEESASRHLALALECLEAPRAPALVLVGGAVGTGKSTLAGVLADALGAAVVSSDRVRKHRLGLAAGGRADASAYTADAKAAVYAALLERAEAVVASGRVAVLDATFGSRREREAARAHAAAWKIPVFFVEACCAPEIARARLERRRREGGDPSDAGPELQAASLAGFEPLDEWPASQRAQVHTDAPAWQDAASDVARRVRDAAGRQPSGSPPATT
jgi:aminoglycoside phosphotransferase family enzyme/predicted kinase